MKFSPANAKTKALYKVPELAQYLNKRKVYSFDLLSGHSCPFAHNCLSKVVDGKLIDGEHTEFRCFSATQEVIFPAVYKQRLANFTELRGLSRVSMVESIVSAMPSDLGICRISVAGDMFNQNYFDAWVYIAQSFPDKLFYTYTKSLTYWIKRLSAIPRNLVLTASYGGRCDHLISEYKLRSANVVFHPSETTLEIDHTDEHAARPSLRNQSFSLLLHSQQKAKSEASYALQRLKKENITFSYSRK